MGIDSAIAGEKGVPVIFVSGDDKVTAEAEKLLPHAVTVETKKSLAYTRIISKHPATTEKEIYQGVKQAVAELDNMKCFSVSAPVDIEIRYQRADKAKHARLFDKDGNNFEQTDAFTRRGKLRTVEDLIFRI